jgi:hypothetical protein
MLTNNQMKSNRHPKLFSITPIEFDTTLTFDECVEYLENVNGLVNHSWISGRRVFYLEAKHQQSVDFSLYIFMKGGAGWAIAKMKRQKSGNAHIKGELGLASNYPMLILFGFALCLFAIGTYAAYAEIAGLAFVVGAYLILAGKLNGWIVKNNLQRIIRKTFGE